MEIIVKSRICEVSVESNGESNAANDVQSKHLICIIYADPDSDGMIHFPFRGFKAFEVHQYTNFCDNVYYK